MGEISVPNPGLGFPLNAVLGGVGSAVGALWQNSSARNMAREQMRFQERMSSTAYQRAVVDMRKAGLNPMLAYMQGGASSPGGASASMSDVVGAGTNSARAGLEQRLQMRIMGEQLANVSADTAKKNAEKQYIESQTQTEGERRMLMVADQFLRGLQTQSLREQLPAIRLKGRFWQAGNNLMDIGERLFPPVNLDNLEWNPVKLGGQLGVSFRHFLGNSAKRIFR